MNVNKAMILGNVTRDPEIRSLPSGQNVASFGVATNRFWTDKVSGEKKSQVEFHNVVAFGRSAEIAQQFLKKGGLVYIEGRLQTRTWQDQQGNKKNRTEIVAERLQLGPRMGGAAGRGAVPAEEPAQEPAEEPAQEEPGSEEINVEEIPF